MVAITTSPRTFPPTTPWPASGGGSRLRLVGARRPAPRAGRRLGAALLVLVLAVAVGYLLSAPALDTSGAIPVQDSAHVVAEGETMWSIAAAVAPAGEAATYVERLVAVNETSTVTPGQVLRLPVP